MGSAWEEKDLLPWARQTLSKKLLGCMSDAESSGIGPVRTPWEFLEMEIEEVEVDGEIALCGMQGKMLLEFDLNLGMRARVAKSTSHFDEGAHDSSCSWAAIIQLMHFEAQTSKQDFTLELGNVPQEYVDEVAWFLREGVGRHRICYALDRWHADAVKRFLQQESTVARPPGMDVSNPLAFRRTEALASPAERGRCGKQHPVSEERSSVGGQGYLEVCKGRFCPASQDMHAQHDRPTPQPATQPLPGGAPAGTDPADNENEGSMSAIRNRAECMLRKRQFGSSVAARAAVLSEALASLDFVRAFQVLDRETVNFRHAGTGRCAIHWCVLHRSSHLLRMVIAARAEIDAKDDNGRTALLLAAQKGDADLCRLLVDAGAKVSEQDTRGLSASDVLPTLPCDKEKIKVMLDQKEHPMKYGETLIAAIQQKDPRTAESAIDAGASVSLQDDKGDTALTLLAKGKWTQAQDSQVKLAERCVKAGASVNAANKQGSSALHYAAHRSNLHLIESLLRLQANPTSVNAEGNTALMFAAHGGSEQVCRTLLEACAPAGATNNHGLPAHEIALKKGFSSCAALLQAHALAPKPPPGAEADPAAAADAGAPGAPGRPPPEKDYSKLNTLERKMAEAEDLKDLRQQQSRIEALKSPAPGEDRARTLAGSSLQESAPAAAVRKKGDIDYTRWEQAVNAVEQTTDLQERREYLEENPEYVWRHGRKMRVLL